MFIDVGMLNHPCTPVLKLAWSQGVIFWVFLNMVCKQLFVSIFIREIDWPVVLIFVESLSGFRYHNHTDWLHKEFGECLYFIFYKIISVVLVLVLRRSGKVLWWIHLALTFLWLRIFKSLLLPQWLLYVSW